MRLRWFVGAAAAVLAACAHPQSAPAPETASAACQDYPVDRAWLRGGPVYQPCGVDAPAEAIRRAPTGYHPLDCKDVASATLLVVVDAAGVPEPRTVRVVRSTSADFATAAGNALRQWRYTPARKGGRKVRQIVQQRFDFQCQQVPQGRGPA